MSFYSDWLVGQYVSPDYKKELIREFVICTHCDNAYAFESPCGSCESANHTEGNCNRCKIFYAKGKIAVGLHFCVHCKQDFELRGVQCNLCLDCLEEGHSHFKPEECVKCNPKSAFKKKVIKKDEARGLFNGLA